MTAGPDEMEFVPVDADASEGKPLIAAVESYVLPDPRFVLLDEVGGSVERGFLFDRKSYDQIRFGSDSGMIKSSKRRQQSFDVSCVVANARGVDFAVSDLSLDLEALLKDGVQVSVKDYGFACRRAFPKSYKVAFGIE